MKNRGKNKEKIYMYLLRNVWHCHKNTPFFKISIFYSNIVYASTEQQMINIIIDPQKDSVCERILLYWLRFMFYICDKHEGTKINLIKINWQLKCWNCITHQFNKTWLIIILKWARRYQELRIFFSSLNGTDINK